MGHSVSGAGDVNNDGYDDIVIGIWRDDAPGVDSGSARVYSGLDGSILYEFTGDNANDWLGWCVSGAGDVNNDGFADVIVGARGDDNNGSRSGTARVYSGLDGSVLYDLSGDSSFDFLGYAVSEAGDVNNDGYDDFIVGVPGSDPNGSGSARVYSGGDGSILYIFYGADSSGQFGISVSDAGDVNNDGYVDVIVGANYEDQNGEDSGSAYVFSGFDGSNLYTFYGDSVGDSFGFSSAGAGDVNNDGYDDFIIGASNDDHNGEDSGNARVYSGLDGSILHTFYGDHEGDLFGFNVSGAGDVNADGYADLIVGAFLADNNGFDRGSVYVYSGLDGALLYTFSGDSAGDQFGTWVSDAGDVNNDGIDDFIVGAWFDGNNGPKSGSARVYLSVALPPVPTPCPGNLTDDDMVDVDDLNEVLSNWGSTCP